MNRSDQKKLYFSKGRKILFGLLAFAMVWFIMQRQGIGQKQDVQEKWSVETHDKTNFPLVGKHRTTSCRECHLNLVFEGTPRECEACHWERRQDDRYQLKLGIHCGECHTPYTWKNVSLNKWNHSSVTGFELKGVHRTFDCADCHGEEGFNRLRVDCFDCHEEDYLESDDPDHEAAGFPYQCKLCHLNQSTWKGAIFSHDTFTLKGNHKVANCLDCHSRGQYAGLSTDCVTCHLDEYNSANDPDHKALNFPTDCGICHYPTHLFWSQAVFDHQFPIGSGKHASASCTDCHVSSNYREFSCLECHTHNKTSMDNEHQDVAGYVYQSQACYACHPQGRE
jgi:Zn finger protein HypA/HybF involved in hydrogenase expression